MGLRGPKKKHKVRARRGFAKKILTEEEIALRMERKRSRDAARERDYSKEWKERMERVKLLTEGERNIFFLKKKMRDKARHLAKRASRLKKDIKAISKANDDVRKALEPATPEVEERLHSLGVDFDGLDDSIKKKLGTCINVEELVHKRKGRYKKTLKVPLASSFLSLPLSLSHSYALLT